jgi:hypothetical protein
MSERTFKRRYFEASYDGFIYTHRYSVDPRPLIGGVMITLVSPPLLWLTWPAVTTWVIPVLGVALVGLAFCLRHRFTASAEAFVLSWSLGPLRWTRQCASREVEPMAARGRKDTYRVLLRTSWRTFDPWIEASSRAEAEAWVSFLSDVSRGIPARWPKEETPWPLRGTENRP